MQHTMNIHTYANTIFLYVYIDITYTYRLAMLLGSAEWLLGFWAAICIFYGRCDSIATNSFNGKGSSGKSNATKNTISI